MVDRSCKCVIWPFLNLQRGAIHSTLGGEGEQLSLQLGGSLSGGGGGGGVDA